MYILEDEELIRQAIKKMIPWESMNLVLCGESGRGDAAFADLLALKPDILICDIQVPGKKGLDVIREARPYLPSMKSIILSGYQEFEYAKQAIDLNVESYLLKPVKQQELNQCLQEVCACLDQETKERKNLAYARNSLLVQSLEQDAILPLEALPLSQIQAYCVCISYCREQEEFFVRLEQKLEHLSSPEMGCSLFRKPKGEFGLIFSFRRAYLEYQRIQEFFDQLRYSFLPARGLLFAAGIAVTSSREIPSSYHTAKLCYMRRTSSQTSGILFYQEIAPGRFSLPDAKLMEELKLSLSSPRREALAGIVRKIYDALDACLELTMENYRDYTFFLCFEIIRLLHVRGVRTQPYYERCTSLLAEDCSTLTPRRLYDFSLRFVLDVAEELDARRSRSVEQIVFQVKSYVDSHYQEPLSLNQLAGIFHVNAAYLSTLFKKHLGMGFAEYLSGYRTEKAKDLLASTSLGVGEIACLTGYENPHYFSQNFRRITGLTPSEYRAKKGEEKT